MKVSTNHSNGDWQTEETGHVLSEGHRCIGMVMSALLVALVFSV